METLTFTRIFESFDGFSGAGIHKDMTVQEAKKSNRKLINVDGSFWVPYDQYVKMPADVKKQEEWYKSLQIR